MPKATASAPVKVGEFNSNEGFVTPNKVEAALKARSVTLSSYSTPSGGGLPEVKFVSHLPVLCPIFGVRFCVSDLWPALRKY